MQEQENTLISPEIKNAHIKFTDKTGKQYFLDKFDFPTTLGEYIDNPYITKQILDSQNVSDIVFPKTRVGEPLYEGHLELINETQSLVVIREEVTEECVGFFYNNLYKIEGKTRDLSMLDFSAVGIDPRYEGKGILQNAVRELLKDIQYDIVVATTVNPGFYIGFKKASADLNYLFYPNEKFVPEEILEIAKRLVSISGSPDSYLKMDESMVRRNYLKVAPQGNVSFNGFKYFENDLKLNQTDGVYIVMLKTDALRELF